MDVKTTDNAVFIPNVDLFEIWVASQKGDRQSNIKLKIKQLLQIEGFSDGAEKILDEKSNFFSLNAARLWKNCSRNRKLFESKHCDWLQGNLSLPSEIIKPRKQQGLENQPGTSNSQRGRPKVNFEEASRKTKIRRVESLVLQHTSEELCFAAERSLKLDDIPHKKTEKTLSTQQTLALYYDLNLSVKKYNVLRSVVNALHKNCFPSYRALLEKKNEYIPSKITVTEVSAEVDLDELLQKTVDSILKLPNIDNNFSCNQLKLQCKWGFDGSAGHSVYKQKFTNEYSDFTDEYLFFIAFVPLKLFSLEQEVIWSNVKTSSTHYCRPIKFLFIKENAELVRHEENKIQNLISQLAKYEISFGGKNICITFDMILTMFDGSVANILSDTNATSRCIVFRATPKEMNLDTVLNKSPSESNYRFGLSSLHCWIRFFECSLHISYRLPFQTWQAKGEENKKIMEETKRKIQISFKSRMGLIVDKPKPGYGSTNDGITARRFFFNPKLSSEITGISEDLIKKFSLILRVIASGCKIDTIKFKRLLTETRKLYLDLYKWYYMPSTVDKVLVHGCDIIDFFDLPIGKFSEEALEARHKEFRNIRLCHSRKSSRINSNTDIIRTLLITSDPEIGFYRSQNLTKKSLHWDSEIYDYIIQEEPVQLLDLPFEAELFTNHMEDTTDSESE